MQISRLLVQTGIALSLTSCASIDEDALQRILDASVGQQFEGSRWSGPTSLKRVLREDNDVMQVFEIKHANGCTYQIAVGKTDGAIAGWHFVSDPKLCKNIMHRALGS